MSLDHMIAGQFGRPWEFTLKQDEVARDLSSFTTVTYVLDQPDDTVVEKVAGFKTDGTDGIVSWTPEEGDLDLPGTWTLQVRLTGVTAELSTVPVVFVLGTRLAA